MLNRLFPNKEQLLSIIRSLLIGVFMFGVGKGWFSEALAYQIVGVIVAFLAGIWGVSAKTEKGQVEKAAVITPISPSAQAAVGIEVPIAPKVHPVV